MGSSVAVVGAGISGLAAAWQLVHASSSEAELTVTVFEASGQVGGKLRLAQVAGIAVDVGAESMLARRPEGIELVHELGAGRLLAHPAPVTASIVSGGRRWRLPRGTLMGVPGEPESVRGLLSDEEVERVAAETLTAPVDDDVAVGDFIDDRLGSAVTDKLVEPLLAGVYAGHARRLSLELAVPALYAAAREGRSILDVARAAATVAGSDDSPVFATLRGGLGLLPGLLAQSLRRRGVRLRTDTTVRGLRAVGSRWLLTTGPTTDAVDEVFDAVVLATPAPPTARLLAEVAPAASATLSAIDYASTAIVTLALDGSPPAVLDGSGILVPPGEALSVKAATFSTVKWPWLALAHPDTTFVRASVGRAGEVGSLQRSDTDLIEVVLADLATMLGDALPPPRDTHAQRWGGALPQYAVGHRARVEAARHPAPGLVLCGAAYDGVGIPACIGSGRRAAGEVLVQLGAGVGGRGGT